MNWKIETTNRRVEVTLNIDGRLVEAQRGSHARQNEAQTTGQETRRSTKEWNEQESLVTDANQSFNCTRDYLMKNTYSLLLLSMMIMLAYTPLLELGIIKPAPTQRLRCSKRHWIANGAFIEGQSYTLNVQKASWNIFDVSWSAKSTDLHQISE